MAAGPYPLVANCIQSAIVLANDAAQSILGNLLADNQPFTLPMADLAHKTLRKMLTKRGVNTYSKYAVVNQTCGLRERPIATVRLQLMYTGYYNGQIILPSPTLPSDMIEPLEVWERGSVASGTNQAGWKEVKQASDSISTRAMVSNFRIWDWESDILYLPGAVQSNDLKFKYLIATPRLTSVTQQVPIADCEVAMGALIAELLSMGRGGPEATAQFHARAESEVNLLATPTTADRTVAACESYNRKPFRRN